MSKRLVYICSPCRGDYEKNKMETACICRIVMNHYPDVIPIAPHIYFPQFLDDTDPTERSLGMEAGLALLDMCDEIWVYGLKNPSEGMQAEIDYALKKGIKIRDGFDHNNGAMQPLRYAPGDTVYDRFGVAWTVTTAEIHKLDGKLRYLYRCGHPGTNDYCSMYSDEISQKPEVGV